MSLNCAGDWEQFQVANRGWGTDPWSGSDWGADGVGVISAAWTTVSPNPVLNCSAARWRRRSMQADPFGKGLPGAQKFGGKPAAIGLGGVWTCES